MSTVNTALLVVQIVGSAINTVTGVAEFPSVGSMQVIAMSQKCTKSCTEFSSQRM